MNTALDWLLGLDRIRLSEGGAISLRFATPPAPWIMLFGAVAAALAVWLVYRREALPIRWRWSLMVLRFGAVMTVLFVCGRPMLVLSRTRVEPSYVAVLVDRSASMAVQDAAGDGGQEPETSRWAAALRRLTHGESGLLGQLIDRHEVGVWTFGQDTLQAGEARSTDELGAISRTLVQLESDDPRTNLGRAMRQVLRETLGRRVAAFVVVSDGRQTEPVELEPVLAQAAARSIPVHTIAAGSTAARSELAMVSVWAPEEVFVRDTVAVQFSATASGIPESTTVNVELIDEVTGDLLASTSEVLAPEQVSFQGDLQFKPPRVGRSGLIVRLAPLPGELNVKNNEAHASIHAHDEKIGVLYVESFPRFEYRYLKNLLLRESNIESSCLLLEASPGFPQEGTVPIRRFPRSIEELRAYDVIILGDVDPRSDWLTPSQQAMLVDFVSVYGGGLAFVAGDRNMPRSLRQTPLEKLLPVEIDPRFSGKYDTVLTDPFLPRMTPEGRNSALLRLEADEASNERTLSSMPGFLWYAQVAGARPGATVLAVHPSVRVETGELPLAVIGRFGVGRTFYLGTDEWWRWRQYAGDIYYDTIWLQVIRTLARGKKLGISNPWRLETDHRQYELGDEVVVQLSIHEEVPPVRLSEVPITVSDLSDAPLDRLILKPQAGAERLWQGRFIPRRAGNLVLSAAAPMTSGPAGPMAARKLTRAITVSPHDPEQARLEADFELLRLAAARTGGEFQVLGDDGSSLIEKIPDRSVQIADDVEESIWDTWLMLGLFVTLMSTEWALRRARGLA